MSELEQHCPRAKLLVGSWQCPCHGLEKVEKVERPKKSKAKANPVRPQRTELTPEQIAEIRVRYTEGTSMRTLASEYHCHYSKISKLVADIDRPAPLSDPVEQEEVRRLYQQGVIIKDLAAKFGTNKERVSEVLGDLVRRPAPAANLTEDQVARVRRAYAHNESIRSIASRFNVNRRVIYHVLGKGDMREPTAGCPSTIVLNDAIYSCHLRPHAKGTHRTSWRDNEDRQFRVEWQ